MPAERNVTPVAQAPSRPQPTRLPAPRPVSQVPNPSKPKLVRDVHGGTLLDMFAIFPDLPWPRYPRPRTARKK